MQVIGRMEENWLFSGISESHYCRIETVNRAPKMRNVLDA